MPVASRRGPHHQYRHDGYKVAGTSKPSTRIWTEQEVEHGEEEEEEEVKTRAMG